MLRGTNGNVTVPGRNSKTYRQLRCHWKIKTSTKRIILLKFNEMWHARKYFKYYGDSQFTIFDGLNMSSSSVLAKLRDFTRQQWKTTTLMSSGSTMTVKLKTKRKLQYRLISFSYTAEKCKSQVLTARVLCFHFVYKLTYCSILVPAKWKLCDFDKKSVAGLTKIGFGFTV